MEKLSFGTPNISSFNNRVLVSQIVYFCHLSIIKALHIYDRNFEKFREL